MKSANALARNEIHAKNETALTNESAQTIAQSWAAITAAEDVLGEMGYGRAGAWHAAPATQNAFASILAGALPARAQVICVNFQAYGWMMVSGQTLDNVMRTYLGKTTIKNPVSCQPSEASDIISHTKSPVNIVAIHAESADDWKSVRAIAASSADAKKPVLMLVSAEMAAPKGADIESFNSWAEAAPVIRAAANDVADQGVSRVIAMNDMDAATIERAVMDASGMNGAAWAEAVHVATDAAEKSATDAYRAPVDGI